MVKSSHRPKSQFLPDGVAIILKSRIVEFIGILLIILALLNLATIISYHSADPSLNNVGNNSSGELVKNMLYLPGAYYADIILQSIGITILLITPIFLIWGWKLIKNHWIDHLWLRVSFIPLMLLAATISFATITTTGNWPFNIGYGGFVGQMLLNEIITLILITNYIMAISAIISIGLFLYIINITIKDWLMLVYKLFEATKYIAKTIYSLKPKDNTANNISTNKINTRPQPVIKRNKDVKIETTDDKLKTGKRAMAERQKSLLPDDNIYHLPPLNLLKQVNINDVIKHNHDILEENARMLENILADFGVKGEINKIRPGPVVALYELEPAPGTKTSRVIGLADDIARSMSAISVRSATIPGRSVIGIELPNNKREMVNFREVLESNNYENAKAKLPIILGKDIGGAPEIVDLSTMPHLLIAGTTGSGKSVALNAMILSLLYKLTPDQCRFIMIDPKMLELSVYDDIPHLLSPVVTDPKKAVVALKWTVREMEDRYRAMSKLSVRNINGYNNRVIEAAKKNEVITRKVQTGFDPETGKPVIEEQPLDLTPLPYIVVVVDEMADLMLIAGKEIEASIQRLAQMARAAGIHIIMATQRPSVDVITGTIKANFPTRISFMVTSKIDSRTILGQQGAEQLLGMGDMLHMAGGGRITRIHGPFVDDGEVEQVCEYLKSQSTPEYINAITDEMDMSGGFDTDVSGATAGFEAKNNGDELYDIAIQLIASEVKSSKSFIQRHLQIGYKRAAKIIEQMEKEGVVTAANHVGKRDVLIGDHKNV